MGNKIYNYRVEKIYFNDLKTLENKLDELLCDGCDFIDWVVRPKRLNNKTMMCVVLTGSTFDSTAGPK